MFRFQIPHYNFKVMFGGTGSLWGEDSMASADDADTRANVEALAKQNKSCTSFNRYSTVMSTPSAPSILLRGLPPKSGSTKSRSAG